MQSSSGGMLSVIGLLACASAAGVLAAHRWPQGPPADMPQRAWQWLDREVLSPRRAAAKPPVYDPAPPFDAPIIEEGAASLDAPLIESPSLAESAAHHAGAPLVEYGDRSAGGMDAANPSGAAAADSALPVRPASTPLHRAPPQALSTPARQESAKTSAFWPNDRPAPSASTASASTASASTAAASTAAAANRPSALAQLAGSAPPLASAESSAHLEALMRRAEQLGAVVVRLERQPGQRGGYLFRCELPLPQNPRYHRYFQATDAEPAKAVERVLRDVEAWQAATRRS